MTVTHARSVTTLAVVVLLGACSAPDLTPEEGVGGPAPASTEAEDDPLADDPFTEGPAAPDAPADPPSSPPGACASEDLAAMDEVIAGQLAAFAADDWEAALGFASRDFREDVDQEAFATLIEEGFPVAADASGHRSSTCVTRGSGTAEVRVEVTSVGGDRADLVYLLIDEDGWRIAGAVPLDGASPDGSDTTTV